MSLLENKESYFGMDLGNTTVRVVECKGRRNISAKAIAELPLPKGIINSDSQIDLDRLGQTLKNFVASSGIKTKNVVTSIPSNNIYSSVIKIPKLNNQELDQAIRFQADKYMPIPLDQAKISWYNLGLSKNSTTELDILLVAAPARVADKYLRIIESAGLNLMALEINSLAVIRSLVKKSGSNIVFIDIATTQTDITIVENNVPKLVRTVPVGLMSMENIIKQNLKLTDEQALTALFSTGLKSSGTSINLIPHIKPQVDMILTELSKSVAFYQERLMGGAINQVIMYGGASSMPGLVEYYGKLLGVPTSLADPFNGISINPSMASKINGKRHLYSIAVGLALRDLI